MTKERMKAKIEYYREYYDSIIKLYNESNWFIRLKIRVTMTSIIKECMPKFSSKKCRLKTKVVFNFQKKYDIFTGKLLTKELVAISVVVNGKDFYSLFYLRESKFRYSSYGYSYSSNYVDIIDGKSPLCWG